MPLLAVDLDDVLANFNDAIRIFHNEEYGTNYEYADVQQLDFSRVWYCSEGELIRRIEEFYTSKYHTRMQPIDGAVPAIAELSTKFDLAIVTSRPAEVRALSIAWIRNHYGDVFTDYHFLNLIREQYACKTDFLKSINAAGFIDDRYSYAVEAAKGGIPSFLMTRGWNQSESIAGIDNLTRVHSWPELTSSLI